ncbi:hypothetical protein [Limosilactobacillus reuteri]|uniref:hypothetical protein n=1 Tax=Limosilactobacillus reuteri TaxID=1598 RepID=UPI001E470D04|nr:hypothetical protein [Limosilactobacillus reuteri]MCC4466859.1 hypothetical protein [Limosilactobacillus reuteri]MCC4472895.1 hypothetical protein [Limosilactobacillus reuteri]
MDQQNNLQKQNNYSMTQSTEIDQAKKFVEKHIKNTHHEKNNQQILLSANEIALSKYQVLNLSSSNWSWMPREWLLNANVNSEMYGLLAFISLFASATPFYQDDNSIIISEADLKKVLNIGWGSASNKFQEMMGTLKKVGYISVDENHLVINRPALNMTKQGFVKIYATPVKLILSKTRGLKSLSLIAAYLAVRNSIFEGKTHNRVLTSMNSGFSSASINMSSKNYSRKLKWLFDNDVLAWNKAIINSPYHQSVYYFSELHDADSLVKTLCNDILDETIIRLIA